MYRTVTVSIWLIFVALALSSCDRSSEQADRQHVVPPTGQITRVVNVIDGDTIDVNLDGKEMRVRYVGVDTPERDEPFYSEAREYNRRLVENEEVILVKDVSETDRFGRLLRYIYLADGTFVNADLIRQGYGKIITIPPDVSQHELFLEYQREAQEAKRGLWAASGDLFLPTGCLTCDSNKHNCGDFSTQSSAQACFEACMQITAEDVHRLDGGGDGLVCESLP